MEINYIYKLAKFFWGAAIVSKSEWTEIVEVTLLTKVELQRELYFCHCFHRAKVMSVTLKHSDQLSKD